MIDTCIFETNDYHDETAYKNIINMVNYFISQNNVNRDDILEYRTKNWISSDGDHHYKVTISIWINKGDMMTYGQI